MNPSEIIDWLLSGDVSIQYQTHRDLLGSNEHQLRDRISVEGWGARFLQERDERGFWGRGFYQPKWTSTHYTLLDLKNLAISPLNIKIRESLAAIAKSPKSADGGIYPFTKAKISDVCINGMFLNYACYFRIDESEVMSVIDFLIGEHMSDGGFNCHSNRGVGASHSSMHSTISVLEGILEYHRNGYLFRLDELLEIQESGVEFLLRHKLFKSHRTAEIIDRRMLMLSYPSRWRYDVLRALDYFRMSGSEYDNRMDEAIGVLLKKRRNDGTWPLQARHYGQTHFEMEEKGKPSRWNTLRALRVLQHFGIQY